MAHGMKFFFCFGLLLVAVEKSLALRFSPAIVSNSLDSGTRSRCKLWADDNSNNIPPLSSMPPLRLGTVIEPTPFTHVSGYSNRFKEMFKYLKKAGDDVHIVTIDDLKDPPTSCSGFPITNIKGFRFPWYKDICLAFDRKRQIMTTFQSFKPELIHCSAPGFIVFMTLFVARRLRVPLVMSYHTHLPLYTRQYIKFLPGWLSEAIAWFVVKTVLTKADLVLVTSPQMKEQFEAHGIRKVAVWRKGVDFTRFNPSFKSVAMRHELSDGHPEAPLLLYVGRLGEEKRIDDLKTVLDMVPGARLALVGKGPAEPQLREKFTKNTKFVGLLEGERLSQAFASADIFVMPSDTETLGFVVIESMASGVPVVGARAGGIPSIIEDGTTGLLANPRDPADFARKIKALLDNPQRMRQMGEAASKEMEKYSWETATSHLRNILYEQAKSNFEKRCSNNK